jgi:hypothetical protein
MDYLPYTGPIVTLAQARAKGLIRYFTGRPCARGHLAERRVANYECTVCSREVGKKYRPRYRRRDNPKYRAQLHRRRASIEAKAKHAAAARLYRARNKVRAAAIVAASKKKNPTLYRAIQEAHHFAESRPHWADRKAVVTFYRNRPPGMEVDHIIPRKGYTAEGYPVRGLHILENLRYLPKLQNKRRSNRMSLEDQVFCEGFK